MADLHVIVQPVLNITKSIEAVLTSMLRTKDAEKAVVVAPVSRTKETKKALMNVLERAADDCAFIAQLTYQGSEALQDYDFTSEEKAALLSGDIKWIEAHIGKLDERLSMWLWRRLQQEIW